MGAEFLKRHYKFLAISIIVILGALVYSNTFQGSFHFDDKSFIINNPSIRNIKNLKAIWSDCDKARFITFLSFALNYYFHQYRVFGYHLFNLSVHLLSALLTWHLTRLTLSAPVLRQDRIAAHKNIVSFFAGLIFVAHPIQTQAVSYIYQRSALLATLFYLACLGLYSKFRLAQEDGKAKKTIVFYYIASLAAAVTAMFTKQMAITLPLMIVLYETCFFKTKKYINYKPLIAFILTIAIIPALLAVKYCKSADFSIIFKTVEMQNNILPRDYLLTQFRVIVTYVRLLFVPINQSVDYYYPISRSLLEAHTLGSLFLLIAILFIASRIFSRHRLASFGIFWFFISLLPESSLIPLKDVIFEHRLYLPMVGFSLFLASIAYDLFGNKNLKVMVIMLALLVNWYSLSTYTRNFVWQDEITLWDDVILNDPRNERAYNNRGVGYLARNEYKKAYADFTRAINIDPNFHEAYVNLCWLYNSLGKYNEAIESCHKATRINPDYGKAYFNLGVAYSHIGKYQEAILSYKKAILADPGLVESYISLAVLYGSLGNHTEAINLCKQAIEVMPDSADAYYNLCSAYGNIGSFKEAALSCQKALKINPSLALAHFNLSTAYYFTMQHDLAIKHCDQAIKLGFKVPSEFLELLKQYRK